MLPHRNSIAASKASGGPPTTSNASMSSGVPAARVWTSSSLVVGLLPVDDNPDRPVGVGAARAAPALVVGVGTARAAPAVVVGVGRACDVLSEEERRLVDVRAAAPPPVSVVVGTTDAPASGVGVGGVSDGVAKGVGPVGSSAPRGSGAPPHAAAKTTAPTGMHTLQSPSTTPLPCRPPTLQQGAGPRQYAVLQGTGPCRADVHRAASPPMPRRPPVGAGSSTPGPPPNLRVFSRDSYGPEPRRRAC